MRNFSIILDPAVLEKYPQTQIGYVVAKGIVQKSHPIVDDLKQKLPQVVQSMGLTKENYQQHPAIVGWRHIFTDDFKITDPNCRSSVEALLARIVGGKKLWNISTVVDLYNCCSVASLLPMGGYDLSAISGDITLRYAKEGEVFLPLGSEDIILTQPNHIIYADNQNVLCWLWNYRDSRVSAIKETTTDLIFFLDSAFDTGHWSMQEALEYFTKNLAQIDMRVTDSGILSKEHNSYMITLCE
jgi:lysyl-tRNA synthetase class 2